MRAWYIISAFNMDELRILLKWMGAEYIEPTCLHTTVRKQQLQVKEQNLLGGYLFAKLDIEKDYYTLMHNEQFYHNVIGVLRTDTDFIRADREVDEWKRIARALSTPLRLRLDHGHFVIASKALRDARLIHYYRRKLKATVELTICGQKHKLSIAAYDIGNRSSAAMELAALAHANRKALQEKKRDFHALHELRASETLKKIRETMVLRRSPAAKHRRRSIPAVVAYTFTSVEAWRIAPWCCLSV